MPKAPPSWGIYVILKPQVEPSPICVGNSVSPGLIIIHTSFIPACAIFSNAKNIIGLFAMGTKCLFKVKVRGRRRVPLPPAVMMAFITILLLHSFLLLLSARTIFGKLFYKASPGKLVAPQAGRAPQTVPHATL